MKSKKVAELLKVSVPTVDNLRKKSGMPYKLVGSSIRFVKEEVLNWIEEQTKNEVSK